MGDGGSGSGSKLEKITKVVIRCPADSQGRRSASIDVWRSGTVKNHPFAETLKEAEREPNELFPALRPTLRPFSLLLWAWHAKRTASDPSACRRKMNRDDAFGMPGWPPIRYSADRALWKALEEVTHDSPILKHDNYVVEVLVEDVDVEPSAEIGEILRWAGVLRDDPRKDDPPPVDDPPPPDDADRRRWQRERLRELIKGSSTLRSALFKHFISPSRNPGLPTTTEDGTTPAERETEVLLSALLDPPRKVKELATKFRDVVDAGRLSSADDDTLQEIASMVLPCAADLQDSAREWREQFAGKVLVLPFRCRAVAELGVSAKVGRRALLIVRPIPPSANTKGVELASGAMPALSAIRAASEEVLDFTFKDIIHEIAYYFAVRVEFGPRDNPYHVYRNPTHQDLRWETEAARQKVLDGVNEALAYHSGALGDDFRTMHIEVDDAALVQQLQSADEKLLKRLRSAFPELGFVILAEGTQGEVFVDICLHKIFGRNKAK